MQEGLSSEVTLGHLVKKCLVFTEPEGLRAGLQDPALDPNQS